MEKYEKKICDALYELLDDLIKLERTKRNNLAKNCVKIFIDKLEVIEVKTVDSDHYSEINMFSSQILDLLQKTDFGVTVNRLWWSDSGLSNSLNKIDGPESEQEKNADNTRSEVDLFGPGPGLDPGPGLGSVHGPGPSHGSVHGPVPSHGSDSELDSDLSTGLGLPATGGDNGEGNNGGGVEIAPVRLEESREFIDVKLKIQLDPARGKYYLLLYANNKRLPLQFTSGAEIDFCSVVTNRLAGDFLIQVDANAEPSKPMLFFTFAEKPSEQ